MPKAKKALQGVATVLERLHYPVDVAVCSAAISRFLAAAAKKALSTYSKTDSSIYVENVHPFLTNVPVSRFSRLPSPVMRADAPSVRCDGVRHSLRVSRQSKVLSDRSEVRENCCVRRARESPAFGVRACAWADGKRPGNSS